MDIRVVNKNFAVAPQITVDDIAAVKELGYVAVINNRPDGESPSEPQVAAMQDALANAEGKVLAYCRSGTRSTLLWSLAQARGGGDPDEIAEAARSAGYDVTPVRAAMDVLSAQANA